MSALVDRWMELQDHEVMTFAEAGAALGVKEATIRQAVKRGRRSGQVPYDPRKPGPKSSQDVDYALAEWAHLREAGVSIEEAAHRLGVSVYTLNKEAP